MGNEIYALFVMLNGFAIGAAIMGAYFEGKLAIKALSSRVRKKARYAAIGKAGFALTGIILMFRVIAIGEIEATVYAWFYNVGLAIAGLGFAGATSVAADELADTEITEERFDVLEGRVTVEEKRNTDIEMLARAHKAGTEDDPSEIHEAEESDRA